MVLHNPKDNDWNKPASIKSSESNLLIKIHFVTHFLPNFLSNLHSWRLFSCKSPKVINGLILLTGNQTSFAPCVRFLVSYSRWLIVARPDYAAPSFVFWIGFVQRGLPNPHDPNSLTKDENLYWSKKAGKAKKFTEAKLGITSGPEGLCNKFPESRKISANPGKTA